MWLHLLAFSLLTDYRENVINAICIKMCAKINSSVLYMASLSGYWDNKKVTNSLLSGTAIYTVHTRITSLVDIFYKAKVKDINQHCFFSDVFLNVVFLFEIPLSLSDNIHFSHFFYILLSFLLPSISLPLFLCYPPFILYRILMWHDTDIWNVLPNITNRSEHKFFIVTFW